MNTEVNQTVNRTGSWQFLLYMTLAALGLVGTWAQGMAYLGEGFLGGTLAFWKVAVTTPASTFLVVDILVLAAAIMLWMFGECHRLGLASGWAWFYFLASVFIAISCFFPLFLAHRERRLRGSSQQGVAQGSDLVATTIGACFALVSVVYSLTHLPA